MDGDAGGGWMSLILAGRLYCFCNGLLPYCGLGETRVSNSIQREDDAFAICLEHTEADYGRDGD